jgi:hypothetical protein
MSVASLAPFSPFSSSSSCSPLPPTPTHTALCANTAWSLPHEPNPHPSLFSPHASAHHPRHDDNLEILPCIRVGRGQYGLVSRALFKLGDRIDLYTGVVLYKQFTDDNDKYLATLSPTQCVDAEGETNCYSRYANDCCTVDNNHHHHGDNTPNAELQVLPKGEEITLQDGSKLILSEDCIALVCIAALIEPRSEITVCYGQKYWKKN